MAGRDLTYKIGVDAGDAVSGLRKLESAVSSTMRDVESELDDSASSGDKFAASIDRVAAQLREDFASSAIAAEELQRALKDVGSTMDVGDALTSLNRMGVSMDEVTADADKFATSLKQLDDVRVQGVTDLDTVAPGLATKLDNVSKSADSSKGALANMIGNSAQDLGELGGVAGSAGVAIGQMAEYFADAAFEGEGLSSVIGSFAKVAGPIALLAGGVAILSAGIAAYNKPAEDAAKRTEELGKAMADGGDDALAFADVLRDNAAALSDFIADANDPLGGFGTWVDEMASKVPIVGGLFKEAGVDIFDASKRAGLSLYALGKQIDGTGASSEDFHARLQAAADAGKITGDEMRALEEAVKKYGDSATAAAKATGLVAVSTDEANAIIADGADPLTRYTDKWNVLLADLADGTINSQAATDAINYLSDALGMSPQEVVAEAQGKLNDAYDESVQAAQDAADAARDHTIAIAQANDKVLELSSTFAEMGRQGDALSAVFDISSAALESASTVRDITTSIGELKDAAKGVKLSDAIDTSDVHFDKFLDAVDQLRPQVQAKIVEAFQTGGPAAAQQTADAYVSQIVAALGGKLSPDKVKELLGISGDLSVTLQAALDQSTAAKVRSELAVLTGLTGETPLTASIALALNAGTITPEAAEALVQAQLGQAGVTVPLDPVTDPAALTEAGGFMTAYVAGLTPTLHVGGDTAGVTEATAGAVKQVEGTNPEMPVGADLDPAKQEAQGFVKTTEATKPNVVVDADTKAAIATMLYLKVLSLALAPTVTVSANILPAMLSIAAVAAERPVVPVTAVLRSYPSAQDIANAIGVVRVPIDAYVRTMPRIDGSLAP